MATEAARLRAPLIALLFVAIAALSSPAGAGTQPTNAPNPSGPVETDDLTITVHEMRWVPDLTHTLRLGGTLVDVSITNNGTSPHDFFPVHFTATSSRGADAIIWLLDESYPLLEIATLEPGETVRGNVLFMTELDAGPITLAHDPSFGADPSRRTTWTGTVEPRPDELTSVFSSMGTSGSSVLSSDRIERFVADVVIREDGTVEIRERITYDFGTRPGRGIVRDLVTTQRYDDRYDRRYPFALGSVSSETAVDDVTIEHPGGGITRLKIGDPDITHTGSHTYEIHYRLEGTINDFDDHQEWYWNVTGHEWIVPIDATEITVRAPADILDVGCWAGPEGVDAPCTELSFDGDTATFSQAAIGGLYGQAGVTVAVMVPAGTVTEPGPILHERW